MKKLILIASLTMIGICSLFFNGLKEINQHTKNIIDSIGPCDDW